MIRHAGLYLYCANKVTVQGLKLCCFLSMCRLGRPNKYNVTLNTQINLTPFKYIYIYNLQFDDSDVYLFLKCFYSKVF